MTFSTRKATKNDLKAINNILRQSKAYWNYDEDFMNRFMREFSITEKRLNETTTLLFFIDNKLAGYYGFIFLEDGTLELDNFFLHPDFIGKGLGQKMWETCCKTAKELGRNEFTIWGDPHAESFYLKMGCKKIGVRQSPVTPDRFPPVLKFVIKD